MISSDCVRTHQAKAFQQRQVLRWMFAPRNFEAYELVDAALAWLRMSCFALKDMPLDATKMQGLYPPIGQYGTLVASSNKAGTALLGHGFLGGSRSPAPPLTSGAAREDLDMDFRIILASVASSEKAGTVWLSHGFLGGSWLPALPPSSPAAAPSEKDWEPTAGSR